jgi:hypothetical protein
MGHLVGGHPPWSLVSVLEPLLVARRWAAAAACCGGALEQGSGRGEAAAVAGRAAERSAASSAQETTAAARHRSCRNSQEQGRAVTCDPFDALTWVSMDFSVWFQLGGLQTWVFALHLGPSNENMKWVKDAIASCKADHV